jgi:deazaflavin-dependent oxidoreductase (nitroreductase family)
VTSRRRWTKPDKESKSPPCRKMRDKGGATLKEGIHMPTRNDALKDRLSRSREIDITVTGRKSGRAISIPVWFVWEDEKLYLLPVQGSDTQWYKNVRNNPTIRIGVRGAEAEVKAVLVTDATQVSSVIEKFRAKYGAGDVKKYYSKFDVAVIAHMQ